jgi:hypothetical protein
MAGVVALTVIRAARTPGGSRPLEPHGCLHAVLKMMPAPRCVPFAAFRRGRAIVAWPAHAWAGVLGRTEQLVQDNHRSTSTSWCLVCLMPRRSATRHDSQAGTMTASGSNLAIVGGGARQPPDTTTLSLHREWAHLRDVRSRSTRRSGMRTGCGSPIVPARAV